MRKLSYSAEMVYTHNRDAFLRCLFVPEPHREILLSMHAMNSELAHVHHTVSEEMIGHIRYAWWEESVQAIKAGQPRREHPVIQTFPDEYVDDGFALVECYRNAYPDFPSNYNEIMETISLNIIRLLCPQAEAGWFKAKHIIESHRQRFGKRLNSLLYGRLIIAGL